MRVAIIGAGLMGRWHADAAQRAGEQIVAVVDVDANRAAILARRLSQAGGAITVDTDLAAVAARARVETVHVCSPLETHAAVVATALECGAHVLVEKPLAPTAEETGRLLTLAERVQRLLIPVHQFTFQRSVRKVLGLPDALGAIRHLDLVVCSAGARSLGPEAAEQIAADILPHALSLAQLWLGSALHRADWRVHSTAPGEWRISGAREAASIGILVSMSGRPTTNTLRVIGDRGTAHVDLFHDFAVVEPGDVSRARKIAHPFRLAAATLGAASANLARRAAARELAYPGLRALIASFYRAARGSARPPIESAAILDVALTRDLLLHRVHELHEDDART